MRFFVTGGAGFIGSEFVRQSLANGDEVTVYDSLTYAGNESTLRSVADHPAYRFVHADICDAEPLLAAMTGHDVVVHFAAESHVDRSIAGPHDFVKTNCMGTNLVMYTALQLDIERVIHISTDEVYGSVEIGSSTEDSALDPRSPYSASKAGSDLIALSYFSTYDLPVIVTRSSNNFGLYQFPEKIIPLFVTNLLDGKRVPLYGDGLNIRDWCHVSDNCAALRAVIDQGKTGEIYNIDADAALTNRELTAKIVVLCNADASMIEPVADRLGHDRRYSMDTSKLKALGWSPKRSFDDALSETVTWYRNNRWWWEPLKS